MTTDEIFQELFQTINDIFNTYKYLSIKKSEYLQQIKKEIEQVDFKTLGEYKKYIEDIANKYLKERVRCELSNPSIYLKIINGYINQFFYKTDDYQKIIDQFEELWLFFKDNNFTISENDIVKIIKSNRLISQIINDILENDFNNIDEEAYDKILRNSLLISFIENYEKIIESETHIKIATDKVDDIILDDPLSMYLREIGKNPVLTQQEEEALVRGIQLGSKEAKDKLIECNLKLVVYIAKKYYRSSVPLQDLIQEGNLGLIKAVDKYDLSRGYRFSTYATWWIKHYIDRSIASQGKTIRVPVNVYNDLKKYKKKLLDLTNELGKVPTPEEISEFLDIPIEEVLKLSNLLSEPVSLNASMDSSDKRETQFLDQIAVDDESVEEIIERNLLPDEINELFKLCRLTPKQIDVLSKRIGLNGEDPKTLEEIGEEYHVTREWIRQVESKAIKKIRESKYCEKYLEYSQNIRQSRENIEEFRRKYEDNPFSKSNFLKKKRKSEETEKKTMPKLKNLYELLQPYSKEEIEIMLTKLTDEDKDLLKLRFPEGFSSTTSSKLTPEQKNKYHAYLVPKMRRMLANPHLIPGKRGRRKKTITTGVIPNIEEKTEEEQIKSLAIESKEIEEKESQEIQQVEKSKEETINQQTEKIEITEEESKQEIQKVEIVKEEVEQKQELEKEDYIKILEILKTKTFGQMLTTLTVKEAIIISLKLGYVDEKYFTTESIANFFGITEDEVRETTKKVLLLYKEEINRLIEEAIGYATDNVIKKQLTKNIQ